MRRRSAESEKGGNMLESVGRWGADVKRKCSEECKTKRDRRPRPETIASLTRIRTDLGDDLLAGSASLETVLSTAADILEVAHAAGTGGLSALSLLAPLVRADLGRGVTARSADLLLEVEGTSVASSADGVRLGAVELDLTRSRGTRMNGEHAVRRLKRLLIRDTKSSTPQHLPTSKAFTSLIGAGGATAT